MTVRRLRIGAALLLVGCGGAEDALTRGDRLWADSAHTESIAEYRLAYARGGGEEALRRLAHAYAVTGQFERANESYETLLADDSSHADQAAYDYLLLADIARARSDGYGIARAAEAALALRPALDLTGLTDQLAQYYEQTASAEQAIGYYERALANASAEEAPELLYRMGRLLADAEDCTRAVPYLRAYLTRAPSGPRVGDARWNLGNCAYMQARGAHRQGDPTRALEQLEIVIDLGVPENIMDQAWFLRGEILYSLGRADEAMAAYQRVLELNPSRTGQLVDRAQRQIDRIRFGE